MSETLTVVADRRVMGEIRCERSDRHLPRLTFTYEDGWRSRGGAYPLSLQMPLSESVHEHAKIEPWMRNLLPDSNTILSHWGVRFQVPPNDPFAMLAVVGEDCPGAIQLVRPERVNAVLRDDRVERSSPPCAALRRGERGTPCPSKMPQIGEQDRR